MQWSPGIRNLFLPLFYCYYIFYNTTKYHALKQIYKQTSLFGMKFNILWILIITTHNKPGFINRSRFYRAFKLRRGIFKNVSIFDVFFQIKTLTVHTY